MMRQKESITDSIYNNLKNKIIFNELHPGEKISENILTNEFNVSRTPIRKVLTWLERDELLEVKPQKGSFISHIDMDRVYESVLMRTVLSDEAAKIACEKASQEGLLKLEEIIRYQIFHYEEKQFIPAMQRDEEFHQTIFDIANLRRIWYQMQTIGYDQLRIRYLKLINGFRWKETIEEHREIVNKIRNKEVDQIGIFLKMHIEKIYADAEVIRDSFREYFA